MTTLTVVVPATNDPPTLDLCLAALDRSSRAPAEVLVVREPPLAGPAEARNAGARRATGDVLVFVDADVLVHPDALARVQSAFDAKGHLDALFGAYDDTPRAPGVVSRFRNLLHHHVHQGAAGPATTFWAGLGAIRRDVFLDAGGFDAVRYPRPSIEDIELGDRLSRDGRLIELIPEIRGTHLKRWTLASMVRTDLRDRGGPWIALLLRAGSGSGALNLAWSHRVSALASLTGIGALVARRPRVVAASLGVLAFLNRDFYALLARREGVGAALSGVPLHALHHLTAIAAIPLGVGLHIRDRRRRADGG